MTSLSTAATFRAVTPKDWSRLEPSISLASSEGRAIERQVVSAQLLRPAQSEVAVVIIPMMHADKCATSCACIAINSPNKVSVM